MDEDTKAQQWDPAWRRRGARDAWRMYSDHKATWFFKCQCTWGHVRRGYLFRVAKVLARLSSADATKRLMSSDIDLLREALDFQREIEQRGWDCMDRSLLMYYLLRYPYRVRRWFLRQRRDWIQAKHHVLMDGVREQTQNWRTE